MFLFFIIKEAYWNQKRLILGRLKKALYLAMFENRIIKQATTLIALTENEVTSYRNISREVRD